MGDAARFVAIQPPLEPSEIAFLTAFTGTTAMRRVWPGQPSARSPWHPSDDGGRLVVDDDQARVDPENVAGWLRFILREFLAPSTAEALETALAEGLRGGHLVTGRVLLDGSREISVDLHRVTERILPTAAVDAVVLDLGARRPQPTER